MASKKILMVSLVRSGRKRWSLSLDGTDSGVLGDIITAVSDSAERRGVSIVNAASPFGETKQPERKERKKSRKPRADIGTKRPERQVGDGQLDAGAA